MNTSDSSANLPEPVPNGETWTITAEDFAKHAYDIDKRCNGAIDAYVGRVPAASTLHRPSARRAETRPPVWQNST